MGFISEPLRTLFQCYHSLNRICRKFEFDCAENKNKKPNIVCIRHMFDMFLIECAAFGAMAKTKIEKKIVLKQAKITQQIYGFWHLTLFSYIRSTSFRCPQKKNIKSAALKMRISNANWHNWNRSLCCNFFLDRSNENWNKKENETKQFFIIFSVLFV